MGFLSENLVLLAEERLDYFLSDLNYFSNQRNQQKIESGQFLIEIQQNESRDTRINRDWLILVSLHDKHSKSTI